MNNETHEDRVKILEIWKKYPESNTIDSDGEFWLIPSVGKNTCVSDDDMTDSFIYAVGLRSLSDIQQLVDMQNEIDKLKEELEQYRNRKNWTRSYDCYGKLINQHALFIPRLK